MLGNFELVLYFLLILFLTLLWAINFGEQALPKLKAYIHEVTAPQHPTNKHYQEKPFLNNKSLRNSLKRRRRSLSYSRNNNTEDGGGQLLALQQQNVDLKTRINHLESINTSLKVKEKERSSCSKCENQHAYIQSLKNKLSQLERQMKIKTQENCELRTENVELEDMLKEQQNVIKLALARIIPPKLKTDSPFCEEHKASLNRYRDTVLSK